MLAIGLDLSLTGSGVAVAMSEQDARDIDPDPRFTVATFGRKGSATESLTERRGRISTLGQEIRDLATSLPWWPNLAMIETPAYDQTSGKTHDRSGLWWEVVRIFQAELGVDVVEVGTSKVKIYATGKGVGRKDAVMAAAIRRYPDVAISNNNESDAFILAAMGMRLLGEPIEESLPQTHLRAMEGLTLP